MNKKEFMRELEKGIAALSEEERLRTSDYFSEMLDERIEDGMSEEEAVASIGSVDEIIRNVLAEVPAVSGKTQNDPQKRNLITEEFDSVAINEICRDVNFFVTSDNSCYVEYKAIPGLDTIIRVESGCLHIVTEDNRRWFEKLRINFSGKGKLDLYLPAKKYQELKVNNVSGDLNFGTVQAKALRGITVNGNVYFGNIDSDELHVHTTNGDVRLEGDSKDIHISTVNGDVSGILKSGKVFHVSTVVGDVRLPAKDKLGGNAHITTVSGDVNIQVKN